MHTGPCVHSKGGGLSGGGGEGMWEPTKSMQSTPASCLSAVIRILAVCVHAYYDCVQRALCPTFDMKQTRIDPCPSSSNLSLMLLLMAASYIPELLTR